VETEIERKFLLAGEEWRNDVNCEIPIRQAYFEMSNGSFRVRTSADKAFFTIKSKISSLSRREFEYEIPVCDAEEMMTCGLCLLPPIEKVRHIVIYSGKKWEIDVFHALNEGLIVAEIELESEDEQFDRPPWLGAEVTELPQYLNSSLYRHPFKCW